MGILKKTRLGSVIGQVLVVKAEVCGDHTLGWHVEVVGVRLVN